MTIRQIDRTEFASAWQEWHRQHERELADPHGFLAVTGIHWLTGTPTRYPGAPGAWATDGEGPLVALDQDEELVVDGRPVRDGHRFGLIPEREGRTASFGDAVVEVAKRGGRDILRPRHPDHPRRTQFQGVPTFPPDPRWVLTGHYLPFETPRPVRVGAAVEGIEHVYDATGEIEFVLGGRTFRLTAFGGGTPGGLTILFTDATSGVTTYAANRYLSVGAPDDDGAVVLDFNRALNLPCAFTDFATCPLPPAENHLPVGIEAGEQTPYERA